MTTAGTTTADPAAAALAAGLARDMDAAVRGTAEHRAVARAAVKAGEAASALEQARERLTAARDRLELALVGGLDPRPHRGELDAADRAEADVRAWAAGFEAEHLRARLGLARRRGALRRELLAARRAAVAARCGDACHDLLRLDAADALLGDDRE